MPDPKPPAKVDGRRVRGDRNRRTVLESAVRIASVDGIEGLTIGKVGMTAGADIRLERKVGELDQVHPADGGMVDRIALARIVRQPVADAGQSAAQRIQDLHVRLRSSPPCHVGPGRLVLEWSNPGGTFRRTP
ncbi:hypothetical protein ABEG18_22400 [Alsobacter sp. KACC 23698]|uniref:Uncharacterized protein n=1 Tax=Alsobacter sp. KACC 23698 TaxID=3149229 RepID=A0AAU7JDF2_9HYPH